MCNSTRKLRSLHSAWVMGGSWCVGSQYMGCFKQPYRLFESPKTVSQLQNQKQVPKLDSNSSKFRFLENKVMYQTHSIPNGTENEYEIKRTVDVAKHLQNYNFLHDTLFSFYKMQENHLKGNK